MIMRFFLLVAALTLVYFASLTLMYAGVWGVMSTPPVLGPQ